MAVKVIEQIEKIFPGYGWSRNDSAPWTAFTKSLGESKVALISSGGVHLKTQPPFDVAGKGEAIFRRIQRDVNVADLTISHVAYNHLDAKQDINCIFPIERFRELEKEGFIGELAEVNFGFMGRIFSRSALVKEMAPALVESLRDQKVDFFYMVPA